MYGAASAMASEILSDAGCEVSAVLGLRGIIANLGSRAGTSQTGLIGAPKLQNPKPDALNPKLVV